MFGLRNAGICALFGLIALLMTGCAGTKALHIESLKQKGAVIEPKFGRSYYYYDRDQTLYFVMRTSSVEAVTGKPVEQIATFRIFWRPIGGKTSMNPTSLNTTYRYVLLTPDSIGMYEGAGFVRLSGKNGAPIKARLMDGDLRLTQASVNFVDTIGRGRMRGAFTGQYDDIQATEMIHTAQQEFFSRSLESRPVTVPGTEPATLPASQPATARSAPGVEPKAAEPGAAR